ncbi:MAG: DUF805 domain-containing protein [Pontiellaceae bacterium]|nr:DUF805 domain-containing protein [Pontiellaceae bacterium]MBN2786431.1 DUF805 domain-containing protein [Pontiellaceae bacterium]
MKKLLRAFSFSGVATRVEWWLAWIWVFLFLIAGAYMDTLIIGTCENSGVIFCLFMLIAFWFLWATQVRRWHDRGKSGWWCLIHLVPAIGHVWAFVELGFFPPVGGNEPHDISNDYR